MPIMNETDLSMDNQHEYELNDQYTLIACCLLFPRTGNRTYKLQAKPAILSIFP